MAKIRDEIKKHALDEDKDALNSLLTQFHWASEWRFVAECSFVGKYPNIHRVWKPTTAGQILYDNRWW